MLFKIFNDLEFFLISRYCEEGTLPYNMKIYEKYFFWRAKSLLNSMEHYDPSKN